MEAAEQSEELATLMRMYSLAAGMASSGRQQIAAPVASAAGASGRFVAVLDFEKSLKEIVSDKSKLDKDFPCEIIEFPTVLVDLQTGEILDEIVNVVKPKLQPQVTPATTELTSITQGEIDKYGVSFKEAFRRWHAKLVEWEQYAPLLATCGDMDMQTSFVQQMDHEASALRKGLEAIDVAECFQSLRSVGGHRWCNIKTYFQVALGADWENQLPWFDEARGVRQRLTQESMLHALNIRGEGHHHRGIDDCRNLAKLMARLFEKSSRLPEATGELKAKSIKAMPKGK